jgi:hypothetical protein
VRIGSKSQTSQLTNQTPIIDLVHQETSITTLVLVLVSKQLLLEPRSWEILWPVPSSYGIKVGPFLVAQISVTGYVKCCSRINEKKEKD